MTKLKKKINHRGLGLLVYNLIQIIYPIMSYTVPYIFQVYNLCWLSYTCIYIPYKCFNT